MNDLAQVDAYGALINTLPANMDANVKNHVFFAGARKHAGTLEAALHPDGVPPEVFHSLVGTVSDNIDTIHRYTGGNRHPTNWHASSNWHASGNWHANGNQNPNH